MIGNVCTFFFPHRVESGDIHPADKPPLFGYDQVMNTTTIDAVLTGKVETFGPGGEPSAIHKKPVAGTLTLTSVGLDGDQQSWHEHGGVEKALLHYAAEHYLMWAREFPDFSLAPGGFGENLTTRGMTEQDVCVGDRYRIDSDPDTSVVVEVSQPRQPCWKLGHNSGQRLIPALMQERAASGWHYRVISPGSVRAGATIELISRPCPEWSLERIVKGFYGTPLDRSFLRELTSLPLLGREWRDTAAARLETGSVEEWNRRLYGP